MLSKHLVDDVLVGLEGKVTDKEGLARLRDLVPKLVGTLLTVLRLHGGLLARKVDVNLTTVNLLSVHCLHRLLGRIELSKLDVTESTRLLGVSVKHDSARDDLPGGLELGLEPVVVDVPGKLADKDVVGGFGGVGVGRGVGLGLLGRGFVVVLGLSLVV